MVNQKQNVNNVQADSSDGAQSENLQSQKTYRKQRKQL